MKLLHMIEENGVMSVSQNTGIDRKTLWKYQKGESFMTLGMAQKLQAAYGESLWYWWEWDAKRMAVHSEKTANMSGFSLTYPAKVNQTNLEGNFRGRLFYDVEVIVLGYSGDVNFPLLIQNESGVCAFVKPSCITDIEDSFTEGWMFKVNDMTTTYEDEDYDVIAIQSKPTCPGIYYTLRSKLGNRMLEVEEFSMETEVVYKGKLSICRDFDEQNQRFSFGDMARYQGQPVIIQDIHINHEEECWGDGDSQVYAYTLEDGRVVNADRVVPYAPDDVHFMVGETVMFQHDYHEEFTVESVDPYKTRSLLVKSSEGVEQYVAAYEVYSI